MDLNLCRVIMWPKQMKEEKKKKTTTKIVDESGGQIISLKK